MVNYSRARDVFVSIGKAIENYTVEHSMYRLPYVGPDKRVLSTDFLKIFKGNPVKWMVVSSGVHGPELFAGHDIQTKLMVELKYERVELPRDIGLVLVHAVNPYGASWLRRTNINNVDLNRNYLNTPEETVQRENSSEKRAKFLELYRELDEYTNPQDLPSSKIVHYLKGLMLIRKHGLENLKGALGVGQRVFPRKLFYGGTDKEAELLFLEAHMGTLVPSTTDLFVHLDIHTGLNERGEDSLITFDSESNDTMKTLFGEHRVSFEMENPTFGDKLEGSLADGLKAALELRGKSISAIQEFGTVKPLTVFTALKYESIWHSMNLWAEKFSRGGGNVSDPIESYIAHYTKQQTLNAFYIDEDSWKSSIKERGLGAIMTLLTWMNAK